MADQNERSFQRQPTVFLNRKKGVGAKRKKSLRYHREVGLGFKTPRETEKAFQKQPTIFLNRKVGAKKKDLRHHKSVGLGFKTPREAIEGSYIDKKCPFTGNVSIRGRILTGVVQKMKMQRTIVIRRDYLHYIRKYNRFEKRHRNMSVHLSPCFRQNNCKELYRVPHQCSGCPKFEQYHWDLGHGKSYKVGLIMAKLWIPVTYKMPQRELANSEYFRIY